MKKLVKTEMTPGQVLSAQIMISLQAEVSRLRTNLTKPNLNKKTKGKSI